MRKREIVTIVRNCGALAAPLHIYSGFPFPFFRLGFAFPLSLIEACHAFEVRSSALSST